MNKKNQVICEELVTILTPLEIYKIFQYEPYSFFLDSSLTDKSGRYSLIGCSPFLLFKSKGESIEIIEKNSMKRIHDNPWRVLKEYYRKYQTEEPPFNLPFASGAVGYFAYDLNRQMEKIPSLRTDDLKLPDCLLGFYDGAILYDHRTQKTYLLATGLPEMEPMLARKKALAKISLYKEKILTASRTKKESPSVPEPPFSVNLKSNFCKESYLQMLNQAIEYIYAGDIYEVNLSQRFSGEFAGDPFNLYERLRRINPAPFAAYLSFQESAILSSSPERFLSLKNGVVETRPIKGTRPRGKTPQEDSLYRQELAQSVKEKAELVMVVDLERNDLGRVCVPGSVLVTELFTIEEFATVFHLVSTVKGYLEKDKDIIDLLEATFPGGSITGAPKIRAMEVIEELERHQRNIYTGSIGYLGFDGNADLNIVIRTIIVSGKKAYFSVGGGIVADSVPIDEYQETFAKAKALIEALNGKVV